MKQYDMNKLLDIFSYSLENRKDKLMRFAKRKGISDVDNIIEEFKNIQSQLLNHFWSQYSRFSISELEKQTIAFCCDKYPWINKVGVNALLRWLIRMCWHEGLIKN